MRVTPGRRGYPTGQRYRALNLDEGVTVAKNPFMSAYLSAANRVANTARGKATGEVKREAKRQQTSMMNAWVSAWTPKPARKRKSR